MRTDILDLHEFYEGPLGVAARGFIAARLEEAWRDHDRLRVAGFGHAEPYLSLFAGAERVIAIAPGEQGVVRWPAGAPNAALLAGGHQWPLPDASIDRLLVVHGLEEADDPQRFLRECWRVMTSEGRLIIVVAHRRGLWSMIDTTPFAHGRPYLKRQLEGLLQESMFRPTAWSSALYFPPIGARFLLRAARAWERAGTRLWSGLGGVILVEAAKDMAQPVGVGVRSRRRVGGPVAARPSIIGARAAERKDMTQKDHAE